jgi:hypothetical protein
MKHLFSVLMVVVLICLSLPANAGKAKRQTVMAITEVSTAGGPVVKTITNAQNATGYLVVKTENETATASLVVTVYNGSTLGGILVCTSTAITTDTTTNILIGSTVAAGEGITDVCDFPTGRTNTIVFTVSGAGADFDVTAEMEWVSE